MFARSVQTNIACKLFLVKLVLEKYGIQPMTDKIEAIPSDLLPCYSRRVVSTAIYDTAMMANVPGLHQCVIILSF